MNETNEEMVVKPLDNNPTKGKYFEAENYLAMHYDFKFNIIKCKVEFKKKSSEYFKEIDDLEFNNMLRALANADIPCDAGKLKIILHSGFSNPYNPFIEYLDSLPKYSPNDIDYIEQLANTVKTDNNELWLKCFKKWFVAMVASALHDNVVNHTVLILSGGQGVGKTSWLNKLIPKELSSYIHCGALNPTDKDSQIQLSECILINLDELGVLHGYRLDVLKEQVTKEFIRVRRAYGHFHQNYVRRASFCGSVNENQFLTDTTGNRRFLCFNAEKIDYQHEINLEMAYAQAIHLINTGFKFYFDANDIDEINEYTERFRVLSMEEEALTSHYKTIAVENAKVFLKTTEIHTILSKSVSLPNNDASIQKLGKALRKHGFISKKEKGKQKWAVELLEA